jgi:hypothetical protein
MLNKRGSSFVVLGDSGLNYDKPDREPLYIPNFLASVSKALATALSHL